MTPKQLRYFARTAEEGSFSAAARVLFIAQPSLSQQIANLEAELGVELFLRQPRGVILTESGEKLLEHAHAILRHIEAAKADVSSISNNPHGTVVVGLTQATCNLLPLYLMDTVAQRYPGITLDITAGLTLNLQQWLREGSIDVAVFAGDETSSKEFRRQPLIRESLFFVTAAFHTDLPLSGRGKQRFIRFAELADFEFILPSKSRDSLGSLVNQVEQQTGVELRKRPGQGQLMTNLSFVLAGECECLLPWPAIHHLVESGLLTAVPVREPELQREVFINTVLDKPPTAALQKTIELIEECTSTALGEGKWKGELIHS